MKKAVAFFLLMVNVLSYGQAPSTTSPSPASLLLFKDVKTRMTIGQKNRVATAAELKLSADKKSFFLEDDPESLYEVSAFPVDLNKDGIEEVFIIEKSTFFGMDGARFRLIAKNVIGAYETIAFENGTPMIIPSAAAGFPDLLIGGAGMEQPIWKFTGKKYEFSKSVKDISQLKTISVEEACANALRR